MGRVIENNYLLAGFGSLFDFSNEMLEKEMRPNPEFTHGFLGVDERLEEVIARDRVLLQGLGVTYESIADAIEQLFATDDESVNGHYLFRRQFIHSPLCPWRDFCTVSLFDLSPKVTEILLLNPAKYDETLGAYAECGNRFPLEKYPEFVGNDLFMVFSDLHPHLIREHHFFEGEGTPYRVDPRRAVRYLGIAST